MTPEAAAALSYLGAFLAGGVSVSLAWLWWLGRGPHSAPTPPSEPYTRMVTRRVSHLGPDVHVHKLSERTVGAPDNVVSFARHERRA